MRDPIHIVYRGGSKCLCGVYPVTYSLKGGKVEINKVPHCFVNSVEEIHKMGHDVNLFCPQCLDEKNIAITILGEFNEGTQSSSSADHAREVR